MVHFLFVFSYLVWKSQYGEPVGATTKSIKDVSVDIVKGFYTKWYVPSNMVVIVVGDITESQLPEPFSFIFTWFAALPFILWLSVTITNAIIKDFLILKGPCPNCGTENTSFFGTILSVSSGGNTNKVKCTNCGTDMVYDSGTRLITLPEGSSA